MNVVYRKFIFVKKDPLCITLLRLFFRLHLYVTRQKLVDCLWGVFSPFKFISLSSKLRAIEYSFIYNFLF